MGKHIIANASVINENRIFIASVVVDGEFIIEIIAEKQLISDLYIKYPDFSIINAEGKYLIPGVIDDQVHFREPGLTLKGDIYTESKAAIAGGITSYMDMPNTNPQTLTQELLEEKYILAAGKSLANFSFYMGASNDNLEEILKTNPENVCGVKVFMGASTGNMLVDSEETLESIFSKSKMLIAVHCENEKIIKENLKNFQDKYGEDIPISTHPLIRSREACYKSSSYAIELAKKHQTRLHVLHLSTKEEVELFDNSIPLSEKNITAEVCVHHLWFTDADYQQKGTLIKWNPAIKERNDRDALLNAVIADKLDIIATDHAPHTLSEKQNAYMKAPSGGPLVQHSLNAMLELVGDKKISFEKVIEKMCHNPAILFRVNKRGFIRKGYYADLAIVDPTISWTVNKGNILYKCGWSPFENQKFNTKVTHTFVNGELVYENGIFNEEIKGKRLTFNR
jgi:dihydroorotase